jgi:hypothetical protein
LLNNREQNTLQNFYYRKPVDTIIRGAEIATLRFGPEKAAELHEKWKENPIGHKRELFGNNGTTQPVAVTNASKDVDPPLNQSSIVAQEGAAQKIVAATNAVAAKFGEPSSQIAGTHPSGIAQQGA